MGRRVTMTLAVAGMHCPSCGLLIDDAVEGLEGVQRCETRQPPGSHGGGRRPGGGDLEHLAYLLGPLGCALGMAVLMALTARGMRRAKSGVGPAEAKEVADLRAEIAELRGKPSGAGDA